MLEQTNATNASLPSPMQGSATGESIGTREARIEDCLDRCYAHLIGLMPYRARQARRAAWREELAQLIAVHQEIDGDSENALEAALHQFERTHAAPQLQAQVKVSVRSVETRRPSSRPATLIALTLFGVPYVADATRLAWRAWAHLFHLNATTIVATDADTLFYRFELLVIPVVAGLLTGLLARHRATRGVLNAIALLAIPAILLPGFEMGLVYAGLGNWMPEWLGRCIPSGGAGFCGVTFWTALGVAGAQAGSWLRRKGIARFARGRRMSTTPSGTVRYRETGRWQLPLRRQPGQARLS
jgi:hypothetical protein